MINSFGEEQYTTMLREYRDVKNWLTIMCQSHKICININGICQELDRIRNEENMVIQEKSFIQLYWSCHFNAVREAYWARRTLWSRLYLTARISDENRNLSFAIAEMIHQLEQRQFDGLDSEKKKNLLQQIAASFQIKAPSRDFFKFLSAFTAPSIARVDYKDIGTIEGKDKDVVRRGILHDAKNHIAAATGFARHILKVLDKLAGSEKTGASVLEKIHNFQQLLVNYKAIAEEIEHILLHYLAGEMPADVTVESLIRHKRIQRLKDTLWELKNFKMGSGDDSEFLILKTHLRNDLKFSMSNANKAIELLRMVTNVWLGWSMMHVNMYNFVDDILTEKQKQLLRDKRINLVWLIEDSVPNRKIFLYDRILQTAIKELLVNAEKYSHASLLRVNVRLNTMLEITVSDNGKGIGPEILQNLFTPYSTGASTKFTGTGLGLSSIKDAIEGVGGEIEVESRPGQGTCFCFRLPINDLHAQIPREKITGESLILAITGLAGSHRKVVARWLAGELGLRYINVGFLIRVLTFYLL
ncbi:MAG TPA: ATP-binding protein, partial [Thermodesulfovibrionia bacterium]|nr:ATP-binding protein [Thermodesulfovibrionia bacterium]